MSVGEQAIAAQLIYVFERTMYLLKTAYNPEFAAYSPGQLITAQVMRYGIDKGMEDFDFLGLIMPWKEDWLPQLRNNIRMTLFAPSIGGQTRVLEPLRLQRALKTRAWRNLRCPMAAGTSESPRCDARCQMSDRAAMASAESQSQLRLSQAMKGYREGPGQ